MHRLIFWFTRLYVYLYVIVKKCLGDTWQSVHGVMLPLLPEIGFNTLRWIVNGKYEENEINIIEQKLVKTDRVMEIGTGLGFVSAFCAKVAGSENVFSFDANLLNIEIAKRVCQKNKVSPHLQNALLSDSECSVDFPINRKSRLASSLFKVSSENIKVPQLNLNKMINDIQPNFLILDIEGAEYDIFSIIEFQSIQKIQVELHPAILGKVKLEKIFSILESNGFVTDIILPDGRNYFFYKG